MKFREHRWHITVIVTDMLGVERNTALYSDLYHHLLWLDFSIPITGNNKQKTNLKHQHILFTTIL